MSAQPELRIFPAHQRLDPHQLAVAQPDVRLVDHVKLLFFQRSGEGAEQPLVGILRHG